MRRFGRQPCGADVRDAIAPRVQSPYARLPSDIGAERIDGGEARTLADQDDRELCAKQFADLVACAA